MARRQCPSLGGSGRTNQAVLHGYLYLWLSATAEHGDDASDHFQVATNMPEFLQVNGGKIEMRSSNHGKLQPKYDEGH